MSNVQPTILGKKKEDEKQSLSNMFTVLGRATKAVAIATGAAALFGFVAAPTAAVTTIVVAAMWTAGYLEHALGKYQLQEDEAARNEKLNKPAEKPSVVKALKSALTII